MQQTLVALFDNRADAEAAMQKLVQAGIERSGLSVMSGKGSQYASSSSSSYDYTRDEGGFWSSLKDLFVPDEDRYAYAEGLSRGGTVLTAKLDSTKAAMAEDVLESSGGSLDLDREEANWRAAGWTGYSAGSAATAPSTVGKGQDETISVYEERLKVGKRAVGRGRVKLRSYVVETPVNEQVSLHEETVEIERHPVDRVVTDAAAFATGERVIEAQAYGEEAVVSKDVRVVEEIGLRKTAQDRTETITDKVRHTEVEIEDERVGNSVTGAGSVPRKPV